MTTVVGPAERDPEPITGPALDRWTADLPRAMAGAAIVGAGVPAPSWTHWVTSLPTDPGALDYLPWQVNIGELSRMSPSQEAAEVAQRVLEARPVELPAGIRPFLRLALIGDATAVDVMPRLLYAPGVEAVVQPAQRPAGLLGRVAWRWPARIGLIGPALVADQLQAAVRSRGSMPPDLIQIHDLTVEPAAVDVLILLGPLTAAVDLITMMQPNANAVIVLDDLPGRWPLASAQLALIRAATGASVSAIGPVPEATSLTDALASVVERLLLDLSHSYPLDVALTNALDRRAVVVGDLAELTALDLPHLARRLAVDLRGIAGWLRTSPVLGWRGEPDDRNAEQRLDAVSTMDRAALQIEQAAAGAFLGESHEATTLAQLGSQASGAIETAVTLDRRWLQCTVGRVDGPAASPPDNILLAGRNAVEVFIGPPELTAIIGGAVPNALLGFTDPDVSAVRLSIALIPLVPRGQPQQTEIEVPRVGTSASAHFVLDVPLVSKTVSARIVLLHANRVLQTAVLRGRIGRPARLTDIALIRPDLEGLEDRRRFDLAIVANHDASGKSAVSAIREGRIEVAAMPEVEGAAKRLRDVLLKAAFQRGRDGKVTDAKLRELLIDLAVEGADLRVQLGGYVTKINDLKRIQITTARSAIFLPLELVYGREAPDDDAVICPSWIAGGDQCGPNCGAGPADTSIVCPHAFWGLSRFIERHYIAAAEGTRGVQYVNVVEPSIRRRRLSVDHRMVGASQKVSATSVKATVAALDPAARRVSDWKDWVATLTSVPSDMLVLMPHTDMSAGTLEISGVRLRRGRITDRYVTGGKEVNPIVMLLGCDTAGSSDDLAGFAASFMSRRAAVVFSSFTLLLNTHAAALAQRLARMLRDTNRREQPMADVVVAFRRQAVRDGVVAALAVTAYGDADWTV